jgi:hypothetical protein
MVLVFAFTIVAVLLSGVRTWTTRVILTKVVWDTIG